MVTINQPYTVGKWTTRVGSEKSFISEWNNFAEWTTRNQQGSGIGILLQNPERPQQFISFGPWTNVDAINAWRDRSEFKAFVVKVKDLCENFQPQSFVLVANSEL